MQTIIITIIVSFVIALVLGICLGIFQRLFAVPVDSKVQEIRKLLSGGNCGGCGFAGCDDFAKAVVSQDNDALKKATVSFGKRCIALIILFLKHCYK